MTIEELEESIKKDLKVYNAEYDRIIQQGSFEDRRILGVKINTLHIILERIESNG